MPDQEQFFSGIASLVDDEFFKLVYEESAHLAGSSYKFAFQIDARGIRDAHSFFIELYYPLTKHKYPPAKRIILGIALAIHATSLFQITQFVAFTAKESNISDVEMGLAVDHCNEICALVFGIMIHQLILRQIDEYYGFEPAERPDLSKITLAQFRRAVVGVVEARNKVAGTKEPHFKDSFRLLHRLLRRFW